MHWTDLVKRAFDHDTDVGAQICEENPARARAHVKHTFKHVFGDYKAAVSLSAYAPTHVPT